MMKRFQTTTCLILFLFFTLPLVAQTNYERKQKELKSANVEFKQDTTLTRQLTKKELHRLKVAKRNFHYNILGGPSYTPDLGLLIGGSALMTFRTNKADTTLKRSVVPFSIALMINGGASIMSKPQLFFKEDRFRIFGQFSYKNIIDNYYGIGYTTNKDYIRSDSTSQHRIQNIQINPWFLFKIKDTDLFIGPQIDISYDKFSKMGKYLPNDPSFIEAGGTTNGYKNFSSGIGFLVTYDTRDVPANAYKGIYFDFRGMMYQKFLGSNTNFYKLELDYRQYKAVGKRKILAWTVQSKNVFGDVPLNKYALSGTPFDLRGYYMGQFRDKTSHVVIAEYRQMINTKRETWLKRVISHIGYTVWGGCGFMGPNPINVEGVLPNVGVGLRIEIQPRMNLRLDLGRDFISKQNLFYFNMTEAF